MRRAAVTLAAVAFVGGCGGDGGSATDFEDVKPCLDRLALVAANHFTGAVTTATGQVTTLEASEGANVVDWSADLAYRTASAGANAAHLAFYKSADAAKEELKRAHDTAKNGPAAGTLEPNFRRRLAKAALVGKSVVLTWSSPPTTTQKQRLGACFDESK